MDASGYSVKFRKSRRRWLGSPKDYQKSIKEDGPSKPKEGRLTLEAQEASRIEG
jgi:hypothetical protein